MIRPDLERKLLFIWGGGGGGGDRADPEARKLKNRV